jgi:hypothetical protein
MKSPDEPTFVCIGSIPLQESESTLAASCDAMIGKLVYVATVNGHGWTHRGHSFYPGYPGVPEPFHARIRRFYAFRMNPRRGFFATVEESGHPFDHFELICCTRHGGQFDFSDRPANFGLLVSKGEPRLADESDPNCTAHWPFFYPAGTVSSFGFADIAETEADIERWMERLRVSQTQRSTAL